MLRNGLQLINTYGNTMITQGTLIYNEDKHTHHALMQVNLSIMQFEKWNMTMYLAHLLNNVTEKKICFIDNV